jgi:spermidine/putrescine transport system substrate-binding protein
VNRRIFLMGVTGALAGCSRPGDRRLNVYNWENYVAESTIPNFEREFHCTVRYATYGSAEELLAKVFSGNSGWDVVFPSNSFVEPMRQLDLLLRLDQQRLPNLKNLEARFKQPAWDPRLEYSVPYMHSATGILYAKSVSRAPLAWADLWADSYAHRVTMLDDPAEVLGACLKRLGASVNSLDESQLKSARDLAMKQKPLLRAYLNEEVRDQAVAGDVLVAQIWAQVGQVAIDNAPNLAFAFPAEGFPLYADNSVILRESTHQDLAYSFIDYLLRPEVASQIAIEMRTATTNGAARAILPAAQRDNTVLYPTADVLARGEWFKALPGPTQRLRDRYWTEIKSS